MDVYDDGQWVAGGDRTIRQNSDRLCAKGTLDMNFVSGDIRQVRYRNGGYQRQRTGAALPQSFGGERRQQRSLRERIAQFGIDKFDCAHIGQPPPFVARETIRGWRLERQARADWVFFLLWPGRIPVCRKITAVA